MDLNQDFIELDIEKVKFEQINSNKKLIHDVDVPFKKAVFGMGCYWSGESLFGGTKGILRTRVGYCGGKMEYSHSNIGDQTEAIEVDYDPSTISYYDLLELFWNNHEYDFTDKSIKRKYMSMIQFFDDEQKGIALKSKEIKQRNLNTGSIHTEIIQASTFYPSEDFHQKYRLQQHVQLSSTLALNSELLQKSYVAAKLNGYLVGIGNTEDFLEENMGLTSTQIEYVRFYMEKNKGGALSC